MSRDGVAVVGGFVREPTKAKRKRVAKPFAPTWYVGDLAGGTLRMRRGALVSNALDSQKRLLVNVGDRLLVCGAALDAIAIFEVVRINQHGWDEWFHVQQRAGECSNGQVHVMNAKGLNRETKRKS